VNDGFVLAAAEYARIKFTLFNGWKACGRRQASAASLTITQKQFGQIAFGAGAHHSFKKDSTQISSTPGQKNPHTSTPCRIFIAPSIAL
jgi:hypothetical protein